jgi:hypothetical protein
MYGYLAVGVSAVAAAWPLSVCVVWCARVRVCGDRCFLWGKNGSGLPNRGCALLYWRKLYVRGKREEGEHVDREEESSMEVVSVGLVGGEGKHTAVGQ